MNKNAKIKHDNKRNMKIMQEGFAPAASKQMATRAEEARIRFIKENEGLDHKMLGKLRKDNPDIADDIWQVAYIEVAANLYKNHRADKAEVSTYLTAKIGNTGKNFVAKSRGRAGVTDDMLEKHKALQEYEEEYARQHGCQPTFEEARRGVAKKLGKKKPIDKDNFMQVWLLPPLKEAALDAPVDSEEDARATLLDLLADTPETQEAAYSNTRTLRLRKVLIKQLDTLSERERTAIAAIAMLRNPNSFPGMADLKEECSWEDVAKKLGELGFLNNKGLPFSRETWRKNRWDEFVLGCNAAYDAAASEAHATNA